MVSHSNTLIQTYLLLKEETLQQLYIHEAAICLDHFGREMHTARYNVRVVRRFNIQLKRVHEQNNRRRIVHEVVSSHHIFFFVFLQREWEADLLCRECECEPGVSPCGQLILPKKKKTLPTSDADTLCIPLPRRSLDLHVKSNTYASPLLIRTHLIYYSVQKHHRSAF